MKLYYREDTGEVYYAVYSKDIFAFTHNTLIPLLEFDIDEVLPDNKELCADLKRTEWRTDVNGKLKYHIHDGSLNSIDNWQQFNPEF